MTPTYLKHLLADCNPQTQVCDEQKSELAQTWSL